MQLEVKGVICELERKREPRASAAAVTGMIKPSSHPRIRNPRDQRFPCNSRNGWRVRARWRGLDKYDPTLELKGIVPCNSRRSITRELERHRVRAASASGGYSQVHNCICSRNRASNSSIRSSGMALSWRTNRALLTDLTCSVCALQSASKPLRCVSISN